MDDELRRSLEAMRQETAAMRQENASARQDNAAMHVETRRHFDVVAEDLRHRVELVAEGVQDTRESLARQGEEMQRGFAETQSMIKFSHSELDRRVRALEDARRTTDQTLTDVQARLDRLESSTH